MKLSEIFRFQESSVENGGELVGRHLMRCHHWMSRHHPNLWLLDVPVDVKPVVFAGQDHRAVIHQGNVEALGVLNLTLECRQDLKNGLKGSKLHY